MQLDDCDSRRARGLFNPRCQKTPIKETKENLQNFRKWLSGKIRDWDGSLEDLALKNFLLDFECVIHILKEIDPTYLGAVYLNCCKISSRSIQRDDLILHR